GAIFGLGLGGVGSVYNLLTQEVENHIEDQETKDQYENDKNELGKDEALNRLAEKDQGKKAIDNTVKTLKEKSQPKREEEQISKPVETQEDITE
ncbi:MAG: hypothetical protein GWN31_14555, partial [Candidatus Thorarchaeota archaeon]|nr:hypothetical protein [Nitrosopumilaceae archaeon]NIV66654.1 hypothetical protein [Nitrosopumilaceae archaeon]NIW15115.1 hypothetical protein [Candidatus Thorarchaeota archaeon]NIX63188.1 hypothetical protein [Nitrosopumilaceae archaeon]